MITWVDEKQNDVRGCSSWVGMAAAGQFLRFLTAPILSLFTDCLSVWLSSGMLFG